MRFRPLLFFWTPCFVSLTFFKPKCPLSVPFAPSSLSAASLRILPKRTPPANSDDPTRSSMTTLKRPLELYSTKSYYGRKVEIRRICFAKEHHTQDRQSHSRTHQHTHTYARTHKKAQTFSVAATMRFYGSPFPCPSVASLPAADARLRNPFFVHGKTA